MWLGAAGPRPSPRRNRSSSSLLNPLVNRSERAGGERRGGRALGSPPPPPPRALGKRRGVDPLPAAPLLPLPSSPAPPPPSAPPAPPPAPGAPTPPSPRHSPARHANRRRRRLPLAAARSFNGSPGPAYGCWAPRAAGPACASAPSARPRAGSRQRVPGSAAPLPGPLGAPALPARPPAPLPGCTVIAPRPRAPSRSPRRLAPPSPGTWDRHMPSARGAPPC